MTLLLLLLLLLCGVVCGISFGQLLNHPGGLHHGFVLCGSSCLRLTSTVLVMLLVWFLLVLAIVLASAKAISDPSTKSLDDADVFHPLFLALVVSLRVCSRSASGLRRRLRLFAAECRVDAISGTLNVRLLGSTRTVLGGNVRLSHLGVLLGRLALESASAVAATFQAFEAGGKTRGRCRCCGWVAGTDI